CFDLDECLSGAFDRRRKSRHRVPTQRRRLPEEAVRVNVDGLDTPAVERDRQTARTRLLGMRGGAQATPAKHNAGHCSSRTLCEMSAREHRTILPESPGCLNGRIASLAAGTDSPQVCRAADRCGSQAGGEWGQTPLFVASKAKQRGASGKWRSTQFANEPQRT